MSKRKAFIQKDEERVYLADDFLSKVDVVDGDRFVFKHSEDEAIFRKMYGDAVRVFIETHIAPNVVESIFYDGRWPFQ